MPVAKVPRGVSIRRDNGKAEILWQDGSDADVWRVAMLLARIGDKARKDTNKGGKQDGGKSNKADG